MTEAIVIQVWIILYLFCATRYIKMGSKIIYTLYIYILINGIRDNIRSDRNGYTFD